MQSFRVRPVVLLGAACIASHSFGVSHKMGDIIQEMTIQVVALKRLHTPACAIVLSAPIVHPRPQPSVSC
jgi:hypothetical protein